MLSAEVLLNARNATKRTRTDSVIKMLNQTAKSPAVQLIVQCSQCSMLETKAPGGHMIDVVSSIQPICVGVLMHVNQCIALQMNRAAQQCQGNPYRWHGSHGGLYRAHAHSWIGAHHWRPIRLCAQTPPALRWGHPRHTLQVQTVFLHSTHVLYGSLLNA